jgi:GAF domain-containing protein
LLAEKQFGKLTRFLNAMKKSDHLPPEILQDIEDINRISVVPTILDVICLTTGMGFAAIARVTEDKWIACSVKDEIQFGLTKGGELQPEATVCNKIRQSGQEVVIDVVDESSGLSAHRKLVIGGFQSYISVPILRKDGSFFGTLCAIDLKPAKLNNPQIVGMFKLYADLISFHLSTLDKIAVTESTLLEKRKTSELREQFIAILGHGHLSSADYSGIIPIGSTGALRRNADRAVIFQPPGQCDYPRFA